jgi:arylsulfatase A-like enzyme
MSLDLRFTVRGGRAIGWFVAILTTPLFAADRPQPVRPNVLLVITDDQGYGDLSLHGNPVLQTPHLDALARSGVRLDDFHVSPVCSPTRASLLTGRYSLRTGVRHVTDGLETMRADEVTLAELFRAAGYRTALFGKWHNGENYPYTPQGQGFDTALGYNLGHWNNYFDTLLKQDGRWVRSQGYIVDALTSAAIADILAPSERPFFCYVSLTTPHSPFQVPDREFAEYKAKGLDDRLACIYAMCANLDANVGRLLKTLDEYALAENTLVVFLTDNGPNGDRFNAGLRGTKGTLHEGGTRVPCFLRWPGKLPAGKVVSQLAAHIDLLPTLAELCDVPLTGTKPLDGTSLVPLLTETPATAAAPWPERHLVIQWMERAPGKSPVAAVRTEQHRLVGQPGRWQLFDLLADPGEATDLAAADPATTTTLARLYDAFWADVSREIPTGRFPIPVGHARENPVELSAAQAQPTPPVRFNGRHHNNAWLTGWTRAGESIRYEIDVIRPGLYELSVEYGMPPTAPPTGTAATLRAFLLDQTKTPPAAVHPTITGQLPFARLSLVPSPDRVPRDEVYEAIWTDALIGRIHLPEGRQTLVLERVDTAPDPAGELNLRRILLTALVDQ